MPSLREHFGCRCPSCRNDILQQAPSTNRMPGEDRAWCPSCGRKFSLEDLTRGRAKGPSLMRRLFGSGSPQ